MNIFKTAFLLTLGLFLSLGIKAQMIEDPTTWTYEVKKKSDNVYDLVFHLSLKEHWHIFSIDPGGDGFQIPPSFSFDKNKNVKLVGSVKEKGNKIVREMDGVDGPVNYFEGKVDFTQTVEVSGDVTITGTHEYQVCDDAMCLPPKDKKFSFKISAPPGESPSTPALATGEPIQIDSIANVEDPELINTAEKDTVTQAALIDESNTEGTAGAEDDDEENKSLLWLFLMSVGGGIAAVLTPCVYSMIPITVSFFTKRSKTRAEGIRNAFSYSLSIIIIFTLLGVLISAVFGGNALNNLSTNWLANLFFFVIFIIFGVSFLGAFEITLPSKWTNVTDSKAGFTSFGGIFFMALTLVIVSFSCTGPIIGPLLVIAGKGGLLGPTLGMLGFSIGLAMPFALFAVFPGLLNKMAASGGWLNQVKVVLGFLELMLALKFLSNADLAQGWRLLDREIFIAIWIVLAVMLGIYLLGKLKLSHDDESPKNVYGQEYVSLFRLFLAMAAFTFSIYLLPGMWGAPLNGMSQFLPPMGTQNFVIGENSGGTAGAHNATEGGPEKYVEEMRIYEPPVVRKLGLVTYFDYEEALAAAKKQNKPLMLDFTGINCVNCRKMESQVWSQPEVASRLKNDFIVASLYCDYDKIALPPDEQYYSDALGSQVTTLGDKNEDLQASMFNSNSQPFYYFVDGDGNKLINKGYGYDPDVPKFIEHLEKVKENYRQRSGS